jgi:hypothetical protein
MRRALPLLVLLVVWPGSAPAQTKLLSQFQQTLQPVERVVADTLGRSVPVPSPSAGVSYSFDPATGNFRREPATFGQVYLERADPLGARRLNLSFAYQYVELDELEGRDAAHLRDAGPIPFRGRYGAFKWDELRVEAAVHQFLFGLTYGVTQNLDASIAVPVVYSDLLVGASFRVAAVRAADGMLVRLRGDVEDPTRVAGVGDVLLRAKYRLVETGPVHLAGALVFRLPSGDAGNLQGVGFFEVTPAAIASTRIFQPARWARLQAHLNAGVGVDTEDVAASEGRWGLGVDWGLNRHVTAAVAILARHGFSRVAPAGSFDFPRCTGSLVRCAIDPATRRGSAPLFGLTGDRPDHYALSVGGRGALWRDTLFAMVDLVVPLNDGVVRAAPVPLVGLEATF